MLNPFQAAHAGVQEICIRRSFYSEDYRIRPAVRGELVVHLEKEVTVRRCSYRYAGPSLWNAFSQDIHDSSLSLSQLQHNIETFLYRDVYHI